MYAYSAIISSLDLGVINNQTNQITMTANTVLTTSSSPVCIKYAVICLQFVLHSKSLSQWDDASDNSSNILSIILGQITSAHTVVHQQAVKSLCIILQNAQIRKLKTVTGSVKAFVQEKL